MTFTTPQEATTAGLIYNGEFHNDINTLIDAGTEALGAFGLTLDGPVDRTDTGATLSAGPMSLRLTLGAADSPRINVVVQQHRASELLHPRAATAILAEVISLLIERTEGDTVDWTEAGILIDAARFSAAFTPIRLRGGLERITPRRVRRDDKLGTPMHSRVARPMASTPLSDAMIATSPELKAIFSGPMIAAPAPTKPRPSNLSRISAWTATASVGVMNPVIGVPLIAYNLIKGADVRVSGHAFALTATLSGVLGPTLSHLPFF